MHKKKIEVSIYVVVLILFFICLIASFNYKQLQWHGSAWAFEIAKGGQWILDLPFSRFSSMIPQTPAVLGSRLGTSVQFNYWLFCLGYFIYPFLSLGGIYYYLRKHNKTELIFPLILTMFLTIVPTWSFSSSIAPEAIVIYWFIYCYVLTEEAPKVRTLTYLNILLLFSYETGLIFYLLTVYLLWREKKLTKQHLILSVTFITLQLLNLFFVIIPANGHKFYKYAKPTDFANIFIYSTVVYILTGLMVSARKKLIQVSGILLCLAFVGYGLFELYEMPVKFVWMQSHMNRIWVIPAAFMILCAFYEYWRKSDYKIPAFQLLLILVLAFPGTLLEAKLGVDNARFAKLIEGEIRKYDACHIYSIQEIKELTDFPVSTWDLPYLSLVYNRSSKIKTLLFKDFENQTWVGEKVICRVNRRFIFFTDEHTRYFIVFGRNYDFSAFKHLEVR